LVGACGVKDIDYDYSDYKEHRKREDPNDKKNHHYEKTTMVLLDIVSTFFMKNPLELAFWEFDRSSHKKANIPAYQKRAQFRKFFFDELVDPFYISFQLISDTVDCGPLGLCGLCCRCLERSG
jgi:hypothetical protein